MIPELPQELIDQIIDHLHNDEKALYECSLVSHDWLDASRVHKFAKITLGRTKRANVDSYHGVVAAPYIQELTLYDSPSRPIPTSFANVRRLRLVGGVVPGVEDIPSLLPFPMLNELTLIQCKLNDFNHLAHLLHNFPRLSNLTTRLRYTLAAPGEIKDLPIGDGDSCHSFTGSLVIDEARARRVMESGIKMFIHLLPALPGGVHFRSIDIITRRLDVTELNALLKACGSNLETLDLSEAYVFPPSDAILLDLSFNNNLHILSLPTVEMESISILRTWLPSVLSTIQSHSITQMTFTDVGYSMHPWKTVDELLSTQPCFENLHKFRCCFRSADLVPDWDDYQLDREFRRDPIVFMPFPRLRSRGILEIQTSGVP